MIDYTEIYNRFVNKIDDPILNRKRITNIIDYYKTCYSFMIDGLSYFTSPPQVADLLAEQIEPEGEMETLVGTNTNVYNLTMEIPTGAEIICYIAGKIDNNASVSNGIITFSRKVPTGVNCAVEYYVPGKYTGDFSKVNGSMSESSLIKRIKEIIVRCMVLTWTERNQNSLLLQRDLLTDTDFKLHSTATQLKANVDTVESLRMEIYNLQTKLDYDLRNINKSRYGY